MDPMNSSRYQRARLHQAMHFCTTKREELSNNTPHVHSRYSCPPRLHNRTSRVGSVSAMIILYAVYVCRDGVGREGNMTGQEISVNLSPAFSLIP